jgi:hypothetical protein
VLKAKEAGVKSMTAMRIAAMGRARVPGMMLSCYIIDG